MTVGARPAPAPGPAPAPRPPGSRLDARPPGRRVDPGPDLDDGIRQQQEQQQQAAAPATATRADDVGGDVLSRIAESLFWIGRYVERAEDTARILDVHIHHLLGTPVSDERETCRALLAVMGLSGSGGPPGTISLLQSEDIDARQVTELLAFDAANPSSIVSSLTAARANARGVSEAISSEMWEALNATYNSLSGQVALARRAGVTGVSVTIYAPGRHEELGRGGRYICGESGTGDRPPVSPDAILRAAPAQNARQRLYIPLGADPDEAARMRRLGYATIAALAPVVIR